MATADNNNWQQIAEERFKKLAELQTEYEEFQATSREFEAELERELDMKERALKDANNNTSRIIEERDALRVRVVTLQGELTRLQEESTKLRESDIALKDQVRQLEQKNDDLERTLRVTATSLEEMENRFNKTLEEKALLSTELSDKEVLQVSMQRLKDEVRDLKQELSLVDNHTRRRSSSPSSMLNGVPDNSTENTPGISESCVNSQPSSTSTQTMQHRRSFGVSSKQAALDCVQQLINCVSVCEIYNFFL